MHSRRSRRTCTVQLCEDVFCAILLAGSEALMGYSPIGPDL
jgi:hypothetical protein